MKTLHRRCAGLDVHSDTVAACARLTARTKASHEVRRFSTATRDLLELADWLAGHGVTHVAMEATGVYWKPVWHMLEGRFELMLANAAHIRNVPGRNDAVWISDLSMSIMNEVASRMLDRRLDTRAVQGARLARTPGTTIPLARRVINPLLIGAAINTPRITRQ